MRAWVIAVLLVGCAQKKDECTTIKARVKPLIAGMAHDANKPISDAELDQLSAEFCKSPASDSERKMRKCILDAKDQPAAAACLETEFAAYQKGIGDIATKYEAERVKRETQFEAELAARNSPSDAAIDAHADSAIDAAPPVDVTTLPAWPVPPHPRTGGPETEVWAVDTDTDRLLVSLWPSGPLIAKAIGGKISGHVAAPSRAAAFDALAATAGFTYKAPKLAGHGAEVDFQFGKAPMHDLLLILGDTMHLSIVAPVGSDVDVVTKRVPADAVLDAVAALDDRKVEKHGLVWYVLGKAEKLPPLPKLASTVSFRLLVKDGTAADALASLRAVTSVPISVCGGKPFSLKLVHVSLAEAVRAVIFLSGGDTTHDCPIADATHPDPKTARLVALASSDKKDAAVIAEGATSSVIRSGGTATFAPNSVEIAGTELRVYALPPEFDLQRKEFPAWAASIHRTSTVIRMGAQWIAWLDLGTSTSILDSLRANMHPSFDQPDSIPQYTINAQGVQFAPIDLGGTSLTIPLR